MTLAVAILLVPVFLLFLLPMGHQAMTWMVFGFVLAFAATMSAVTEAKVQEVFVGTAACVPARALSRSDANSLSYCAVLVTFLGNLNQGLWSVGISRREDLGKAMTVHTGAIRFL